MYLNDSSGNLVLDGTSYPISKGSAYVFNEGLPHETINTGFEPRLLLGPMSEQGFSVGRPSITYFSNQTDAENDIFINRLGLGDSYTLGDLSDGSIGSFTRWKIASISTGSSSQAATYNNGNVLNSDGWYNVYPGTASPSSNKPKNQRQALRRSLRISDVWDAYKYYESNAVEYGFVRISFKNYRKLYRAANSRPISFQRKTAPAPQYITADFCSVVKDGITTFFKESISCR